MATFETNGDGRATAPAGVYRHPDSGEELVTTATAKFGNPQADAMMRLGFQYVGPAKLKQATQDGDRAELLAQEDPTAAPTANTDPSRKTADELRAELADAEAREKKVAAASKGNSDLVETAARKESESATTPKPTESRPTEAQASEKQKGAK